MSRVYVVHESRYPKQDGTTVSHDYTSLYRYGQVEFLLPPTRKQMEETEGTELDMLRDKLKDFNLEVDYMVFSGDPVLSALAAMTVYALTEGTVLHVLKWNRKDNAFEPLDLNLP